MANLYAKSTGSNTAPYDTWAKAATDPATAVNAASAGDKVYVYAETYTIAADSTWTLAGTVGNPVTVLSTTDSSNAPPTSLATGVVISAGTSGSDLKIRGHGYVYGVKYSGTGGTSSQILELSATDNSHITLQDCSVDVSASSNTASGVTFGAASNINNEIVLNNFVVVLGSSNSSSFSTYASVRWKGGSITSTGTPTKVFSVVDRAAELFFNGVDFSGISGGTMFDPTAYITTIRVNMVNCKLSTTATLVGAFNNVSQLLLNLFNCASSDTNYQFASYDAFGSTIAVTSPTCDDGAKYDGTNPVAWKITTTAAATRNTPYVSPWIDKYRSVTSAITPYLECLRDNSSGAVYTDAQISGEWSYQGTTGFPLALFSNDGISPIATAANQTASSKGASDWTGETGTAGYFTLNSPSITPAEIGMLRARVLVGEPSVTVYVDPTIRGAV